MIRENIKHAILERYFRKREVLEKHPEYTAVRKEREAVKFQISCIGLGMNEAEEKYMRDLRDELGQVRFI